METREAVYKNLVRLASCDGQISKPERRALTRYRRALRLPRNAFRDARRKGRAVSDAIEGTESERVHVFRMLARVAWADGKMDPRERRRLVEIAANLGLGEIQGADILVEAEEEHHQRVRQRRLAVGIALVIICGGVFAWDPFSAEAEPKDSAVQERRIDSLTELVLDLEKDAAREHRRRVTATQSSPSRARFQAIERACHDAILLIAVEYVLRDGRRAIRRRGTGTGFFVSPDGLVVTNKHVLQPWLFSAEVVKRLDQGWTLDRSTIRVGAWPAGARALGPTGAIDWSSASWTVAAGSLAVEGMAPDTLVRERRSVRGGGHWEGLYHANNEDDLAVLRLRVRSPATALSLSADLASVQKLDPVMVLGFPTGTTILEGGVAESSASLGEVRKVQDTIYVTAPIVPGNSGGPLVDEDGRAIGVATRIVGGATVGCCLPVHRIVPLLPTAEAFLTRAESALERGDRSSVARFIALATLKRPTTEQLQRVIRLKAQLK